MPNYNVQYAFTVADAESKPENERQGFGIMPVNTERPLNGTDEDIFAVAQEIGRAANGKYASVQVLNISERILEVSPEAPEGEITLD